MRLLPVRTNHVCGGAARQETQPDRRGYRRRHERQHLPLRHLPAHSQSHPPRRATATCQVSSFPRFYGTAPSYFQRCLMSPNTLFDRREFLKTAAAGGAVLLVGFHLPARAADDPAQAQEKPVVNPFNAWVKITPDNKVTLVLGKSEMGQGVMTSLPMILAEELCVDWKQVSVEQAPTDPKIYDLGTGGSGSVAGSWLPLRQAGAAAREMFIQAAANKWEVTPDTCKAKNG